jgi:hypothetical protein
MPEKYLLFVCVVGFAELIIVTNLHYYRTKGWANFGYAQLLMLLKRCVVFWAGMRKTFSGLYYISYNISGFATVFGARCKRCNVLKNMAEEVSYE